MSTENRQILLEIHTLSSETFLSAIADAPRDQLSWKPAPDSRSIAEICRHVIRVESWFLSQMGYAPQTADPGNDDLEAIESALHQLLVQTTEIVQALQDDAELQTIRRAAEAKKDFTLDYVIKHMAQHKLYHFSQICYLRRALDRSWEAPLKQWEKAVDTISNYTWKL